MMGGGFDDISHAKNTFFERADLIIFDSRGKQLKILPFRLDSALAGESIANKKLEMGNEIKVYSYQEIYGMPPNTVSIRGHVKNPGTYEIVENFNISDLLFLAGGFQDEAHLRRSYLGRFDLYRFKPDFMTKELISYDLSEVLEKK